MKRFAAVLFCLAVLASAQTPVETLRANLTYLASDELEGRGTPSHGLDLAAEFIAKQFQQEGLEPLAPDGSYFQTAKFAQVSPDYEGFALTLKTGTHQVALSRGDVWVRSLVPLDLTDQSVIRLPPNGVIPPVEGLIVAVDLGRAGVEKFLDFLRARKPAAILLIGNSQPFRQPSKPALLDTESNPAPEIQINNPEALEFLREHSVLSISLHLSKPEVKEARLRNVAGILPGSDPDLRDQWVLLTAHYDHLGHGPQGIFHGANDNASGTVSVIEIARELAALPTHPKRSILFMAFFGEEEGLLGSYYYTRHPLVPLKNTIANINLEQIGRTDDNTGQKAGEFAFTGPSYTNLPGIVAEAAKAEGVKIEHRKDADEFFARSDNYAFAVQGVPDSTIAVAFEYPEYHAVGDTADKIDFENMAKVDRAIAEGIARIANESGVPQWSGEKGAAGFRNVFRNGAVK